MSLKLKNPNRGVLVSMWEWELQNDEVFVELSKNENGWNESKKYEKEKIGILTLQITGCIIRLQQVRQLKNRQRNGSVQEQTHTYLVTLFGS